MTGVAREGDDLAIAGALRRPAVLGGEPVLGGATLRIDEQLPVELARASERGLGPQGAWLALQPGVDEVPDVLAGAARLAWPGLLARAGERGDGARPVLARPGLVGDSRGEVGPARELGADHGARAGARGAAHELRPGRRQPQLSAHGGGGAGVIEEVLPARLAGSELAGDVGEGGRRNGEEEVVEVDAEAQDDLLDLRRIGGLKINGLNERAVAEDDLGIKRAAGPARETLDL